MYIREAHPAGSARPDPKVKVDDPETLDERCDVAKRCLADLGLEIPTLIDGMDDAAERAYDAWPDRLYLVDADGKIAYRSGPGPRGFKPEELEAALKTLFAPRAP